MPTVVNTHSFLIVRKTSASIPCSLKTCRCTVNTAKPMNILPVVSSTRPIVNKFMLFAFSELFFGCAAEHKEFIIDQNAGIGQFINL